MKNKNIPFITHVLRKRYNTRKFGEYDIKSQATLHLCLSQWSIWNDIRTSLRISTTMCRAVPTATDIKTTEKSRHVVLLRSDIERLTQQTIKNPRCSFDPWLVYRKSNGGMLRGSRDPLNIKYRPPAARRALINFKLHISTCARNFAGVHHWHVF